MYQQSWLELTIAVRSISTFFVCQVHIVFHHFVNLHAQLLIDFPSDYASVDEQSYQKAGRHYSQDNEDGLPGAWTFTLSCIVILFNELDTFFWRIYKRAADEFKNLWSFEQSIEITVVDGDLRVEKDWHFSWFLIALSDYVILILFKFSLSLSYLGFNIVDNSIRNMFIFHSWVRTILHIFKPKTVLSIKYIHIFPPLEFLVSRFYLFP